MKELSIGVLASTKASDLKGVMEAINKGELNAKVSVLISNKKDAYCMERARKHSIPAVFIDPKKFPSREEFDKEAIKELEKRKVELVLLIGYMRFLSKPFIEKYKNKVMNIHPSLLPAFAGGMDKDVHQEVLDAGVEVSGCTLHFATEELDSGPIILQKEVRISGNETVDSLKEKVQKAEQEVLVKAIKLFGEGKIKVEGEKVKILK
ncbi:MAG: phosphoribosylglycinamide formyltransferase [archaeon]|nr:phosphoribosylglycinamide formyltransferase [Candidatus Micrarchaeota archaeon]